MKKTNVQIVLASQTPFPFLSENTKEHFVKKFKKTLAKKDKETIILVEGAKTDRLNTFSMTGYHGILEQIQLLLKANNVDCDLQGIDIRYETPGNIDVYNLYKKTSRAFIGKNFSYKTPATLESLIQQFTQGNFNCSLKSNSPKHLDAVKYFSKVNNDLHAGFIRAIEGFRETHDNIIVITGAAHAIYLKQMNQKYTLHTLEHHFKSNRTYLEHLTLDVLAMKYALHKIPEQQLQ